MVFVRSQIVQRTQSPFDFGLPQEQQGEATGSGFVIDKAGTILTNAHVVNGATKVTVQFQNKQSVDAKVLGKDESTDLALLKVDPSGLKLTPLTLGSSKGVQVGDPAIAIGNPFGLERTLTTGVISAVQRTIQAPNNFEIDDVLQTDAPINPGNSGGPLIDATGKVIGINSQIATGGSGSQRQRRHRLRRADRHRQADHPRPQAVRARRPRLPRDRRRLTVDKSLKDLNLPVDHGALVQSVAPGGPADKAGIRAGDLTRDARQPPDPARRRHHHQGRRQGDPHQATTCRPPSRTASRATRSRSRCVRGGQGQDRRGHARRASEHGRPTSPNLR